MKYLSPEQVLFIHSRIIDATGGAHGILDAGLLRSAVARPLATFGGKDLYADLFHKAAALMESLARNHPFIDGNKRTAIAAASIFLSINGHVLECTQKELERFALSVATGRVSFEPAAAWFQKHSEKRGTKGADPEP
ncbi:MAG: type II toxin-antitoxin system death-on-curing family toxin [Nitrospiraceae bacterium]|nr:type II toxin-antitoxin system death-on-curing family toxin [Nitrospiraceae bacterium]